MPDIIEKRFSLHKQLINQKQQNNILKSQISQLQARANIGIATCMIAHEINNLLTPLACFATLALNNSEDKALTQKTLQKTAKNCERASKIMESILAVANGQTQEKKDTNLISMVEEIFLCLARDFSKDSIIVNTLIHEDITVWAIPIQIQQVLMNLILNAREAMLPHGGTLTIKAIDKIDTVQVELTDNGCGIEPNDLTKIFDSFFTTKANEESLPHSGSGLGLALCKQIIDAHDGSICVESKPAIGSIFKITLPKSGNS